MHSWLVAVMPHGERWLARSLEKQNANLIRSNCSATRSLHAALARSCGYTHANLCIHVCMYAYVHMYPFILYKYIYECAYILRYVYKITVFSCTSFKFKLIKIGSRTVAMLHSVSFWKIFIKIKIRKLGADIQN